MSNGIQVKASMQLQQTSPSAGQSGGLMQKIMFLQRKLEKIDDNDTLTDKEKEIQKQAIQNQIDALNTQIENIQKKQEQEQKAEAMQQERKRLENTMDPEAAEMAMQLTEMMKVAVSSDASAAPENTAEDTLEVEEDVEEVRAITQKAESMDEGSKVQTQDEQGEDSQVNLGEMDLEEFLAEIRKDPDKEEILRHVKEGLLVDEYR